MATVFNEDARRIADLLEPESVDCVCTSPPYYRKKRYINPEDPRSSLELGQEESRDQFVSRLLEVMDALQVVVKSTGVVFVNLDDTYAGSGGAGGDYRPGKRFAGQFKTASPAAGKQNGPHKSLMMIPWRFAIAAQERGWILRSIIPWIKGRQFEGGVRDRPHHSWEPFFMFVKRGRGHYGDFGDMPDYLECRPGGCGSGHIAPYPEELIEPLIQGGCPVGGTVLDPFAGSGTTLAVAEGLQRQAVGFELNPEYVRLIEKRLDSNQLRLVF